MHVQWQNAVLPGTFEESYFEMQFINVYCYYYYSKKYKRGKTYHCDMCVFSVRSHPYMIHSQLLIL